MNTNKLLKSTVVYDTSGQSHAFNMYRDCGYYYYYTIDDIKFDWSFPFVSSTSALMYYDLICGSEMEVDHLINWALGDG